MQPEALCTKCKRVLPETSAFHEGKHLPETSATALALLRKWEEASWNVHDIDAFHDLLTLFVMFEEPEWRTSLGSEHVLAVVQRFVRINACPHCCPHEFGESMRALAMCLFASGSAATAFTVLDDAREELVNAGFPTKQLDIQRRILQRGSLLPQRVTSVSEHTEFSASSATSNHFA